MNSFKFIVDSFFISHIKTPLAVVSAVVVLIIVTVSVMAAKEIKKNKAEKADNAGEENV